MNGEDMARIAATATFGTLLLGGFGAIRGATLLRLMRHPVHRISGSRTLAAVPGVGLHTSYHFFMAGIFTIVAGIMIAIVAATQLRQGKRTGKQ